MLPTACMLLKAFLCNATVCVTRLDLHSQLRPGAACEPRPATARGTPAARYPAGARAGAIAGEDCLITSGPPTDARSGQPVMVCIWQSPLSTVRGLARMTAVVCSATVSCASLEITRTRCRRLPPWTREDANRSLARPDRCPPMGTGEYCRLRWRSTVTIFWRVGGAMCIGTLLSMPRAQGLFHRAIAQSGAAHPVIEPRRRVATCAGISPRSLASKQPERRSRWSPLSTPAAQAELDADLFAHPAPRALGR